MEITSIKGIDLLQFNSLPSEKLFTFSTTIQGGVSTGVYSSLNLSPYSMDNPECVTKNQEYIANIIGVSVENLYIPCQIHKDRIVIIDNTFLEKSDVDKSTLLQGVDAAITNQRNICIGIITADCVPLLIYDPVNHILAAVHAGWKGTVSHIAGKVVSAIKARFGCNPSALLTGIGPCISQQYFEVGEEVARAFEEAGFDMDKIAYRNKESEKMHIDLQEANKMTLTASGILPENIESACLCTYSHPELFFSARRQTVISGRMLTGGVLR